MDDLSSADRNDRVINPEAFHLLLAQLDSDPERAGFKYEKIRRKVMDFFRWRGCGQLAEDYTDRTFDRVARRIAEGDVKLDAEDSYRYFYGVAVNLWKEHWKKTNPVREPFDERLTTHNPSVDPHQAMEREIDQREKERRLECLNCCLEKLPAKERDLIMNYHLGEEASGKKRRHALAQALGLTLNALRIRVYRICRSLERSVEECVNHRATP